MSYLISDCTTQKINPRKISFTESFLTKTVVNYNKCFGNNYLEYKEEIPFTKFSFGVLLGVSFNRINNSFRDPTGGLFGFRDYSLHLKDNYKTTSASIGTLVNISFPRVSNRLAIQTGTIFSNLELISELEYIFSENTSVERRVTFFTDIELSSITIPALIQYCFSLKDYNLNFIGGLTYSILNQTKNSFSREEFVVFSDTTFEREFEDYNFRNSPGFQIGASLIKDFSKFSLGLDYRLDVIPVATVEDTDVGV